MKLMNNRCNMLMPDQSQLSKGYAWEFADKQSYEKYLAYDGIETVKTSKAEPKAKPKASSKSKPKPKGKIKIKSIPMKRNEPPKGPLIVRSTTTADLSVGDD